MNTTVTIEGRQVELSNLDKILYPEAGFTKAQVIDYYRCVARHILPHLAGRPVMLKRYPDGVTGEFFYEKTCPAYRPDWVASTNGQGGMDIDFCVYLQSAVAGLDRQSRGRRAAHAAGQGGRSFAADGGRLRPRPGSARDVARLLRDRPDPATCSTAWA